MTSPSATLTPEPDAHKFTIYHVDESGKPDSLLPVDDGIVTLIVRCINICRSMLDTPHVVRTLESFVTLHSKEGPTHWYSDGPVTQDTAEEVTESFLGKVRDRFPYILVDDSWTNPDLLGIHWRHEWKGEFETSDMFISLNGRASGGE